MKMAIYAGPGGFPYIRPYIKAGGFIRPSQDFYAPAHHFKMLIPLLFG
jgi:hypothetical protein